MTFEDAIIDVLGELKIYLELQQEVNKALLAYIEADLSAPWKASAQELAEKLREILKNESKMSRK
jgi:hypothetical protein